VLPEAIENHIMIRLSAYACPMGFRQRSPMGFPIKETKWAFPSKKPNGLSHQRNQMGFPSREPNGLL
jgi:hypothetical protein